MSHKLDATRHAEDFFFRFPVAGSAWNGTQRDARRAAAGGRIPEAAAAGVARGRAALVGTISSFWPQKKTKRERKSRYTTRYPRQEHLEQLLPLLLLDNGCDLVRCEYLHVLELADQGRHLERAFRSRVADHCLHQVVLPGSTYWMW